MAYNPWSKRPPTRPEKSRQFALASGDTLDLTLRKLGTVQQTEVYELSQQLTARYVTGDLEFVESGGASGEPPIPFPPVGGELIEPTETMCQGAAYVHVMQAPGSAQCLSPEEWIAFQAVEDGADWLAIQRFTREVNAIGKPADPKDADVPLASGAATKARSERSSRSTGSTRK